MIIPIFIPHEGCPNDCAFCNQRTISGKNTAPTMESVTETIEKHLSTLREKAEQIAFFGGSFTGIEGKKQNDYLSVAKSYIDSGKIKSIRISTRPDYIDESTVKRLASYGVTNIELGAQSMDNDVLVLSGRGHSSEDVEKASRIITESGITLGLQMMTGLPGDCEEKCLYTARKFKELGAKETRIYPTVVLKGTRLAEMLGEGVYTPQTVEEAVCVSAKLYRFFCDNDIKILRIGLSDSLELKENYIAGAYHPSMGELVMSRDVRNLIESELGERKRATIVVNKKFLSKLVGNKRSNISYFENKGIELNIIENCQVEKFMVKF